MSTVTAPGFGLVLGDIATRFTVRLQLEREKENDFDRRRATTRFFEVLYGYGSTVTAPWPRPCFGWHRYMVIVQYQLEVIPSIKYS